jgi:hypothetical protein
MRIATLVLCLALGGCATSLLPGAQPAPDESAAAPAASAAVAVSPPAARPTVRNSPPQASRGPQSAAQRAAPPQVAPDSDALSQARVVCWMQVEQQKLRDIDRRIAFVDKCIADAMKP